MGDQLLASETKVAAPCVRPNGHLDSLRTLANWTHCLQRPTEVMSRQGEQPESRLVRQQPKRTRQQDTDAQSSITPSIS